MGKEINILTTLDKQVVQVIVPIPEGASSKSIRDLKSNVLRMVGHNPMLLDPEWRFRLVNPGDTGGGVK